MPPTMRWPCGCGCSDGLGMEAGCAGMAAGIDRWPSTSVATLAARRNERGPAMRGLLGHSPMDRPGEGGGSFALLPHRRRLRATAAVGLVDQLPYLPVEIGRDTSELQSPCN